MADALRLRLGGRVMDITLIVSHRGKGTEKLCNWARKSRQGGDVDHVGARRQRRAPSRGQIDSRTAPDSLEADAACDLRLELSAHTRNRHAIQYFFKEALDDHALSRPAGKTARHQVEDILILNL
jgi:hypothetical protein